MLSEQVRSRLQELHPDIAIQLDTIIELAPESTDQQVARLQNYASADEIYAFVNALYIADMTRRLDLVAGRMLR